MTPVDRKNGEPEQARRFEQRLLDSAHADPLPQDVTQAWQRFSVGLASAGGLVTHGAGARGARGIASSPAGSAAAPTLERAARIAAIKWLFIGALAGSAATALGIGWVRSFGAGQPSASVSGSVRPPQITNPAPASVAMSAPPPIGSEAARSPSARGKFTWAPRVPARPRHELGSIHSTLGAQVALLDAASNAVRSGAPSEALSLTERYQHQFPTGELLPEAEEVAIEALAAQGDRAAVSERIARFLARYPSDPHAGRVKALMPR